MNTSLQAPFAGMADSTEPRQLIFKPLYDPDGCCVWLYQGELEKPLSSFSAQERVAFYNRIAQGTEGFEEGHIAFGPGQIVICSAEWFKDINLTPPGDQRINTLSQVGNVMDHLFDNTETCHLVLCENPIIEGLDTLSREELSPAVIQSIEGAKRYGRTHRLTDQGAGDFTPFPYLRQGESRTVWAADGREVWNENGPVVSADPIAQPQQPTKPPFDKPDVSGP